MPKVHSASPLSCGLLKSGRVFVSSCVQTYKESWRDMTLLPSIPKVVHRQDGGIALSCQALFSQGFTMILGKNPIPERPTEETRFIGERFGIALVGELVEPTVEVGEEVEDGLHKGHAGNQSRPAWRRCVGP